MIGMSSLEEQHTQDGSSCTPSGASSAADKGAHPAYLLCEPAWTSGHERQAQYKLREFLAESRDLYLLFLQLHNVLAHTQKKAKVLSKMDFSLWHFLSHDCRRG